MTRDGRTPGEADDPSDPSVSSGQTLEGLLRQMAAAPSVDPGSQGHLVPGTVVDGCYRIVRRLGAGGMGVVYLADDLDLDRPVALKLRLGETTADQLARLWREAKIMARLSHPNVVSIYGVGTYKGMLFIAMEYLERGTAREWLAQRARTWVEIVTLYGQAGRGLGAAHAVGVVHRDFKPDNVLVAADGTARVADFGVAQPLVPIDDSETQVAEPSASTSAQRLTQTGTMLGTPAYMAPEQHDGASVDAHADQFSFCVALFEALYGRRPFDPGSWQERTEGRRRSGGIPARVARVVRRGLSANPADRYPDMSTLLAELDYDPSRRRAWAYVGVGAAALTGVVGLLSYRAADHGPSCNDGAVRIASTWNDGARLRLSDAFVASGSAAQEDVLVRTLGDLDGYAQAWGRARDDACRATHVHGEQSPGLLDRRVECLERRRDALAAAVDVLTEGDAAVVLRAVDVTRNLPSLAPCANATMLQAEVEPPPKAAERGVDVIRALIDRSRAQQAAGQLGAAATSANEAAALAETQAYAPVIAEALVQVSSALSSLGSDEDAIEPSRRAYRLALEHHQDRVALEAVMNVPFLVFELSETLTWLETAEALSRRLGLHDDYAADIALIRGTAYTEAGRYELAERALLEAAAAEPDPVRRATARKRLANVLRLTGREDEARAELEDVLATMREAFGERSWLVAGALEDLATVQADADTARALELLDEAITIHRAAAGPDAPRLLSVLGAAAGHAADAGEYQRAKALFEEALALEARLGATRPRGLIAMLSNAAVVWNELGDTEGAVELGERSLALALEAYGREHVATASVRINLSILYSSASRDPEAERELQTAAQTLIALKGPHSRELLAVYVNLVQLQRGAEKLAEARATAERALEVADALHAEPHFDHVHVTASLGLLLREEGRPLEAVEQFVRCAALVEVVRGPDHPKRVDCLYRQGLAMSEAGQDPTAVYEQAAEIVDRGSEVSPLRSARLFVALAERVHRSDRERGRALAGRARKAALELEPEDTDRSEILERVEALLR